jgi:hypothetical protein
VWKRSVVLSRYAGGGAMEIGDSESWSGRIKDGGSWDRGPAQGGLRPDSSVALGPAWMGTDRVRGCGRTDPFTPPGRGHGSSCDMRPPVRDGRRTGKYLDAPEGGFATVGAKARALGQKIEEGLHCLVCFVGLRSPFSGRWHGLAKGEATAGQEAGPTGIGKEPVVADADEALGEDVEQEATRELAEGEGEGPASSAAVVLVAEGDDLVIDGHEPMVGDGDAVGVAGQIFEHVFRGFEGGLGVSER